MNFLWTLAAVAGSVWTGWRLVRVFWPIQGKACAPVGMHASLAVGLGLATSSAHYLLWRATCTYVGLAFRLVDCLLIPALAWIVSRRFAPPALQPPAFVTQVNNARPRPLQRLLVAVTAAVLLTAICASAGWAWEQPLGAWDGWAIWNLKARFMFRGGEDWRGMFSRAVWFSHPDYPLMLPATVARLWSYLGNETTLVPQLLSVGWAALVIALLLFALAHFRSVASACIGAMLLVSCDQFLVCGGSQYADVLLSFFVLSGVVAIVAAGRMNADGGRLLILAGLMAGCAALVKNEGMVFGAALVAGAMLSARSNGRSAWRTSLWLLCGLAMPLLIVAAQKAGFAAETYLVSDQPSLGAVLGKALDPARHAMILKGVARWNFGYYLWRPHWRVAIPLPNQPQLLLLLALPIVCGLRRNMRDRFAIGTIAAMIILVASAYYAVLLIMPYSLEVLLESLPWLQLHLWPALVFVVMLASRCPSEGPSLIPNAVTSPACAVAGSRGR